MGQEYARTSASATYIPKTEGSLWQEGVRRLRDSLGGSSPIALACDIQNEVSSDDAASLVDAGFVGVFEGTDRACTHFASDVLQRAGLVLGISKLSAVGPSLVCAEVIGGISADRL